TRDRNKPIDQKSHTQIPGRQIFTGHKFSPNKTFAVYEKISPRSDLKWQPTGRIFKSVGLRWLPTGKLFDSCTNKVESEPPHGSNIDISKIHKYKQTLDLSAGTSINVPKEQSLDVSAGILWNDNKENLRVWLLQKLISQKPSSKDAENLDKMKEKGDECIFVGYSTQSKAYRVFNKKKTVIMESIHVNFDELPQMASDQNSSDPAPEYTTVTTSNELDLLFSPMFDELLNGSSKAVSKSSAVSAADAPNQRQQLTTPLTNHTTHAPTCQILILAPTVISSENINQAETYAENDQVANDEFINIFSTPVQD
nr:integrase, catalytic region, zinc finger, CCHC-type, peptidase aspartic, catalytic [Tanacetum cinerariifolium]